MFVYEIMNMEANVEGNVVHCLNLGHFGKGSNANRVGGRKGEEQKKILLTNSKK